MGVSGAGILLTALVPALVLFANSASAQEVTPMLQMFDAMQQLMTGGSQFDREYYQKLRTCMDTFDPLLTTSQDAAWQGIINYWNMGGTVDDPWGGYQTNYLEQNATNTDFLGMTIYEPCNYASNMALYHVPTEFCSRRDMGTPFNFPTEYVNALGKGFSSMGMGSSFMHGSHTWLGHQQDNDPIGVVSYLIHQATLAPFPEASSILTDFSPVPRAQTALELSEEYFNLYMSLPVEQWYDYADALDLPDYYYTFAGLVGTGFTIAFDDNTTDALLLVLAEAFKVPQEITDFVLDIYLPELRTLTSDVELGIVEQTRFIGNLVSTFVKLIYAFLWQEQRLTNNPIFLDPEMNALGWEFLPILNSKMNGLNSFEYFEPEFQNGTNIYPGDEWCNPVWPHAKWHLESALGMMDLTYMGDEMFRILSEL